GPVINLSENTMMSFSPQIYAAGNKDDVYVVWEQKEQGNGKIIFRRSTDGGASFGPVITLSENTTMSFSPQLYASGNKDDVYVVWQNGTIVGDNFPTLNNIIFRRSTDGGASFGPVINLSNNNSSWSSNPRIIVSH